MSEQNQTTTATDYSLIKRVVQPPIRNWHHWLERWDNAEDFQQMESLLHCGFNISLSRGHYSEKEYKHLDRVMLYLAVADGWQNSELLRLREDEGTSYMFGYDERGATVWKKPSVLRQMIARKAFDMLCLNFFKGISLVDNSDHRRCTYDRVWTEEIVTPQFLPLIQNFFRVECGQRFGVRNLTPNYDNRTHNEQDAIQFLVNFAEFIWGGLEVEDDENPSETRKLAESAKPWMTEVLVRLNRLDILRKRILKLDEATLAKLKEVALRDNNFSRHSHPVLEDRKVESVEEACYLGSKTAWLLKEYEVVMQVHGRLKTIQEATMRKRDAERELAELVREEK